MHVKSPKLKELKRFLGLDTELSLEEFSCFCRCSSQGGDIICWAVSGAITPCRGTGHGQPCTAPQVAKEICRVPYICTQIYILIQINHPLPHILDLELLLIMFGFFFFQQSCLVLSGSYLAMATCWIQDPDQGSLIIQIKPWGRSAVALKAMYSFPVFVLLL